jgi:3-hydroxybutyryl-CoA dehydrogenase
MGRGIVRLLLGSGCHVAVFDPSPASVQQLRKGLANAHAPRDALVIHDHVASAVQAADLVLETVSEDLDAKVTVLTEAVAAAPATTPIGSNTSSLDLELLGRRCGAASRLLGVHWFNPPETIPGVEVAVTPATEPSALDNVLAFLQGLGKQPVVVRSSPGYVANRLHEALLAEALRCVADGVAGPQEVDRIVKSTFGPRFAVCGPFEVMDQTGLEVQQRAFDNLHQLLDSKVFDTPRTLVDLIAQGRTGLAVGQGIYDYHEGADVVMTRRANRLQAVLAAAASDSEGGNQP